MFWSQNRLLEGLPQTWCIIPGCIPFCPNEENEVTSLSIITMSRKWVGTNTCVCSNKCAHASPCFRGLFFKRMGNWKALKTRGKLWSLGSDDNPLFLLLSQAVEELALLYPVPWFWETEHSILAPNNWIPSWLKVFSEKQWTLFYPFMKMR